MKRLVVLLMILALATACSSKEERRDALIANAKKLEEAGKCPEAKIEARNAIKLDPNSAEAYLALARCDLKEQNWQGAFGAYNRAHELAPQNLEAIENLARLYLMANDMAKSKELLATLLAADSKSVSYRIIHSGVALREKQLNQAIQILKEVLVDSPYNEEAIIGLATAYLENGQPEEAEALISEAIANKESALLVNYMVNIAILQRDYDEATRQLEKLRTFQPENENIILRMVDMYLVTGKAEEAEKLLETELQANPTKAGLRLRLSELMYNAGKNSEGIAVIDQAPTMTPQLQITKATGLMRINKIDEAIAELQNVSTNVNAGLEVLNAKQRLAEIYVLRNRSDEAFKELNEIIQRNATDIKALALRGRLHYLRGQYSDAVADLRVVIRDAPKDSASALALAESERMLGNHRLAEETLRNAISANPDYAPAYIVLASLQRSQGNEKAALDTLRNGAAGSNIPELHFAYVDTLVSLKRYSDAQSYLSKLVSDNKDFALPGTMRLAALNAEQRKFRDARDYYAKALEINPDYSQAAEGYVLMEVGAKRSPQAQAWAENRAKSRPEDPSTMALLAEVYNENKNYDAALRYFKDASRLAPQWDQPYVRIMQIYNAQLKQPEEAVKFLQDSWETNPEVFTPAMILASFHESRKEYEKAETLYRSVMEKNADLVAVNNNLAYIMTLHNPTPERLAEALGMADKAATSNTPETLDTLGWVNYKLGKLPVALESLNKAYERSNGASPAINYHLAVIQNAMGNKEEAKKLLTEMLEKFKNFDEKVEAEALLQLL